MARRFPDSAVFYRNLAKVYSSAVRGEGVYLYDDTGKRYLDACGGALVVNLGHGRRELADAMARQASEVAYVHGSQFTTDAIEEWSASLCRLLPPGLTKLYPVPGGTEATETAIKLARQYQIAAGRPSKHRVIGCRPSYHGNTLGSLSVSGRDGLREPYLPMLSNEHHVPAPFCYRCPLARSYPDCDVACADAVAEKFIAIGPDAVAGLIVEAVLGAAAGAAVPPPEYLSKVRAICDRFDVVLIVDEVMTGFGRTGTFLALEPSGVTPDLLLLGKGLSGGALPAGAVAIHEEIARTLHEKLGGFTHGFTFSHHPVVASVGREVLRVMEAEHLVDRVKRLEAPFLEKLERLRCFDFVGDVRGRGLLAGIELVEDRETKRPFPRSRHFVESIVSRAFDNGLLLYPSTGLADGVDGDAILLAPPFVIEESQIDDLVGRLEKTFHEVT